MLRNLIVQAGLIGDLLDELAINILRYGDRDGGYVLSVGCWGDAMTIALCDTVKSGAGVSQESDVRKSEVVKSPTVPGASTDRSSNGSSPAAVDGSVHGSTNGITNGSREDTAERGHGWDYADTRGSSNVMAVR